MVALRKLGGHLNPTDIAISGTEFLNSTRGHHSVFSQANYVFLQPSLSRAVDQEQLVRPPWCSVGQPNPGGCGVNQELLPRMIKVPNPRGAEKGGEFGLRRIKSFQRKDWTGSFENPPWTFSKEGFRPFQVFFLSDLPAQGVSICLRRGPWGGLDAE